MSDDIKKKVREGYTRIALEQGTSCCGTTSCCGGASMEETIGRRIGYQDEEMHSVPTGSNLGLGCGNPVALASLQPGETVVDLGSGAGFDSFLAARKVGPSGRVIGIDMTPEMIKKAKINAVAGEYGNVTFKLGEIEAIPLADCTADVVISNCVINLSPDKRNVFREAFRILKLGGRLMISDLVLLRPLPEAIRENVRAYIGCVSGAMLKSEYLELIEQAGFKSIEIHNQAYYDLQWLVEDPGMTSYAQSLGLTPVEIEAISRSVASLNISAIRPR